MSDQLWIVVYGDLFLGIKGAAGPFKSKDDAWDAISNGMFEDWTAHVLPYLRFSKHTSAQEYIAVFSAGEFKGMNRVEGPFKCEAEGDEYIEKWGLCGKAVELVPPEECVDEW